jgi:DDE superfamily endonuclease
LQPILRRVYAPKGEQPVVSVNPRYEWLYVYAFVHPNSGRSVWYLLPSLNTQTFQVVLENFARDVLDATRKRVLVVLDNAAWHKSKTLKVPDGLEFVFLPPYSPDLQPAERLWGLCDEPLTNRCLPSLCVLETVLSRQCVALMGDAGRVGAFTRFDWWPKDC